MNCKTFKCVTSKSIFSRNARKFLRKGCSLPLTGNRFFQTRRPRTVTQRSASWSASLACTRCRCLSSAALPPPRRLTTSGRSLRHVHGIKTRRTTALPPPVHHGLPTDDDGVNTVDRSTSIDDRIQLIISHATRKNYRDSTRFLLYSSTRRSLSL